MQSDVFCCIYLYLGLDSMHFFFVPLIAWSLRMITHSLSGGGNGMKGYDALDCTIISRGSADARLGRYNKLCFLPDKATLFCSSSTQMTIKAWDYLQRSRLPASVEFSIKLVCVRLPTIPSSTSNGDIHKLLKHIMYESIKTTDNI